MTEPVYEWKVAYIAPNSGEWVVAHGWYKNINEFITLNKFSSDQSCELIIKSKMIKKWPS